MFKKDLRDKRTYKALFLLNLLSQRAITKNEIIYEFAKNNVRISKTSIVNYIEKLKAYNIPIIVKKRDGVDFFYLDKQSLLLDISEFEARVAQDIKKLYVLQSDFENIRAAMRLFYKFALLVPESNVRAQLADFGYYSKIDWRLVEELKHHCKDKNIIELEYILPEGGSKVIQFHADEIKIGNWSQRLYLKGTFAFAEKFSELPIDRIYMIKKVISELYRFDIETDVLTYKIDKESAENMELDPCEAVTRIEGDYAYVKRPIDDNFRVIQKLLYFCPNLYYISDKGIKDKVQDKLYVLRDMYDDRMC